MRATDPERSVAVARIAATGHRNNAVTGLLCAYGEIGFVPPISMIGLFLI
jgi:hypothetical protein